MVKYVSFSGLFFFFFFLFSFTERGAGSWGFFLERGVDWFCGREMRGHS
jgi:hypothetical protein